MAIAVTTRGYDNARSGANTQETLLTPAAVRARGLRRLFSLPTPGDRRGCEAQPLIVPGVKLRDGGTHDLVVLADMANTVSAFDAGTGALLWRTALGRPVTGTRGIDEFLINDHWGILSTPVIDPATATLYCVTWTSADGGVNGAVHTLRAVDLTTGAESRQALSLEGASYAAGHGKPNRTFRSSERKQRASLVLTTGTGADGRTHKTVFVPAGSLTETGADSRGWVVACDVGNWQVAAAWAAVAGGYGGGIWQAGAGLAADAAGNIYAMTGNGDFDGVTDFGQCFVKLAFTPASGATPAALRCVDWWTPFTDNGREDLDVRGTEGAKPRPTNLRAYTEARNAGWWDQDLGSGGPMLIPSLKLLVGAGKDGVFYVLDPQRLGKTQPNDLADPSANYAKLKVPPIWWTYYPGPDFDSAPQDPALLNVNWGGQTHHQHGSPLFWRSDAHGPMMFCMGENGNLRAWSLGNEGTAQYLACGAETASPQAKVPPGGMPGGMLTLSANGGTDGIVWALIPYGDANTDVTGGRLIAYDATEFGTFPGGAREIVKLWDSQDWGLAFSHPKFNVPVVANGRLYVPTYDGRVDVYGP